MVVQDTIEAGEVIGKYVGHVGKHRTGDYTNPLILLVKNMLCGKLHCQKGFNLNPFSYKIGKYVGHVGRLRTGTLSSSSSLLSSLELSDTQVYEPQI